MFVFSKKNISILSLVLNICNSLILSTQDASTLFCTQSIWKFKDMAFGGDTWKPYCPLAFKVIIFGRRQYPMRTLKFPWCPFRDYIWIYSNYKHEATPFFSMVSTSYSSLARFGHLKLWFGVKPFRVGLTTVVPYLVRSKIILKIKTVKIMKLERQ